MKNIFYKQREDFLKTLPERDKKFTFPDDVEEIKNVPYASDGLPAHRLDIYRPRKAGGQKLPVIVNVHGGGLIIGCKEFNRYFCANLCKKGYLVFSVEYRLVPDCLFFDQCRDVFAAMDFIGEHLAEYSGLPDRIFAVGDSGGACLLTYCLAMQNSRTVAKAAGAMSSPAYEAAGADFTPSFLPVKAAGFISGMFYTTRFDKIGLFLPNYLFGKGYKHSAFAPYVNPEHPDIIKALPPCYLVTSHKDHLRNYTLQFEKALSHYHMPHKLHDFPPDKKLVHAFSVFEPFLKESDETLQEIAEFFQSID